MPIFEDTPAWVRLARTPALDADRILSGDIEAAEAWVRDGDWRDAVASAGVTLR